MCFFSEIGARGRCIGQNCERSLCMLVYRVVWKWLKECEIAVWAHYDLGQFVSTNTRQDTYSLRIVWNWCIGKHDKVMPPWDHNRMKLHEMLWSVTKRYGMLHNYLKMYEIIWVLQKAIKCCEIWYDMPQHAVKLHEMLRMLWDCVKCYYSL